MSSYRLSPQIHDRLRRRTLVTSVPIFIVLVGVIVFITMRESDSPEGMLLALPIITLAFLAGAWRGYRRQVRQTQSFELTISADDITRCVDGLVPLTLRREEIVRVENHASGEITLHTSDRTRTLGIPFEIESRGQLLKELAAWQPVIDAPPIRNSARSTLAAIGTIILYAVMATSTHRVVVISVGIPLLAVLVTCSVLLLTNRQIDRRMRNLGLVILFPVIGVVAKLLKALLG